MAINSKEILSHITHNKLFLQMPNQYVRKAVAVRGAWSQEDLKMAMEEVQNGRMSVYRASFIYNIPRKTLERRLKLNNDKKGPMGPSSTFGAENE